MPTRAAAKREADFLKESLTAGNLSSPPATPVQVGTKRKRAPPKNKKAIESVTGGWDILPHGLGKKGDLEETASAQENINKATPPPKKRARRGKVAPEEDTVTNAGGENIKFEPVTPESSKALKKVKALPLNRGKKSAVKTEVSHVDVKDGDFQEAKSARKRAPRKKKAFDTSDDVLKKVGDLIDGSGKLPKTPRKKKHPYGLTPGLSPFPDHVKPTPEDCEEVNRLLSGLHGEVKPPTKIPPPSMEVTGCGEVPDLLDAILRTRMSASTSANNANLSLKGLKDKFGLRTSGVGAGSINWEAVHRADLPSVVEAIKKGGLAQTKGASIKEILDMVHQQNCYRRDALLKEKETGEPADILGAKNAAEEQIDMEILRADESLLSMDHVFEMTTDEAMEEMTKLPGIGVKTASCVILFCMKRPSFAVDTHVWRHCKWLGWVPERATRDQTFSHCEVRVPDHLKYPLHQLFLRHGKTCGRCRANTSAGTKEWEDTVCPIDHLVNRKEEKKTAGRSPVKKTKGRKIGGKKGKTGDEETEESDVEMEYGSDGDE